MQDDSQATTSNWMATAKTSSQSPLKKSIRTDICIIGAGNCPSNWQSYRDDSGQGMTVRGLVRTGKVIRDPVIAIYLKLYK